MMLEMNTCMYPDDVKMDSAQNSQDVQSLKRNMKLDLNSTKPLKPKFAILSSPDLNLLKLGSPELEKLIIQNQGTQGPTASLNTPGVALTTPTPSQYFFPKNVTEEQEVYARGFIDALNQLHDNPVAATQLAKNVRSVQQQQVQLTPNGFSVIQSVPTTSSSDVTSPVITTLNPVNTSGGCVTVASTTSSYTMPDESVIISLPSSSNNLPTTLSSEAAQRIKVEYEDDTMSSVSDGSSVSGYQPQTYISALKDESQLVPSLSGTPPLSPIDLDTQERIKLERKRLRNRVAAEKCRKRKLEKISRLEDQVKRLKTDICDLEHNGDSLRSEITTLRNQIQQHINAGCQIILPS